MPTPDSIIELAVGELDVIDPPAPGTDSLIGDTLRTHQAAPDHDASAPAVEALPNPFADRLRSSILTTAQVKALQPPEGIIDGILMRDSLAMLYGPSGVGKSFVAADFSQHIAYGAWWRCHEVKGGPTLYVVAEGASGFGLRLDAWESHHQLHTEVHPAMWVPFAVNLTDPLWADAVAQVGAEVGAALIVIDTFARCIVGAEENSARDIGIIVDHLDHIRNATQACVLLVHHSGKDLGRGGRGNSALRGAMDTELELTGDATAMTLKVTKQKDGPEPPPIRLALLPVAGTDSCVIGAPPAHADGGSLPAKTQATLDALVEIDLPGGVAAGAWLASCAAPESTFFRHRTGLLEQGLVVNVGTDKAPRYRATSAIKDDNEP